MSIDSPTPPSPDRTAPPAADARVLIVDDERDVGNTIARLLKPVPVVFAQSAAGALGRIAAGARFRAIVCDINMPGIGGMQFHDEVAARSPQLARRIIYVTGSGRSKQLSDFLARTGCTCIDKPFEGALIRAAVANLLSQPDE